MAFLLSFRCILHRASPHLHFHHFPPFFVRQFSASWLPYFHTKKPEDRKAILGRIEYVLFAPFGVRHQRTPKGIVIFTVTEKNAASTAFPVDNYTAPILCNPSSITLVVTSIFIIVTAIISFVFVISPMSSLYFGDPVFGFMRSNSAFASS